MKITLLPTLILWVSFSLIPIQVQAAERMIAYGYSNCVACHVNPQGRNLLTSYGNSIDEAQSLRAGEWSANSGLPNFDNKVNQIVRAYFNHTDVQKKGQPTVSTPISFLNYQNASSLTSKLTLAFGIDFKQPSEHATAVTPYYKSPERKPWFIDYAFFKYVPVEGFAVSVGKDQLPTGINNADSSIFIHSRNALGNNERPIQLKTFTWTERSLVSTYFFQPNGDEAHDMGEQGFGILAETDVSNNRTVFGINLLSASNDTYERKLAGLYARIGLTAKFGLLTEVDGTWYKIKNPETTPRQQAFLSQIFYTPAEWIVYYLGYENLNVEEAFKENARAFSGKVNLRISRNFTISSSLRRLEKGKSATEVSQLALFMKF